MRGVRDARVEVPGERLALERLPQLARLQLVLDVDADEPHAALLAELRVAEDQVLVLGLALHGEEPEPGELHGGARDARIGAHDLEQLRRIGVRLRPVDPRAEVRPHDEVGEAPAHGVLRLAEEARHDRQDQDHRPDAEEDADDADPVRA